MITTHFTESSYPHQTKLGLLRIRVITSALLCQLTTVTHTHTHIHTPPLRRVHFSRVKLEERSFNSFCNQPAPSSVRVCVCVCASHIWNEIWCENDARRPVNARCCGRCCRWRFGAIKMRIIHPWSISIYGSRGHALYIGSSRNGVGLGCAKWQIRIVYTRLRFRRTGTLVIDDAWC